ncbi:MULTISPECIES: PspC domain-containing protein [unclassified Pedobacter]|uniref:PspC domain-containing protein n=1 Tax=unclassified Pedobacter TaxID=2628915 RepID=UPI0014219DED|nr:MULTISPECIES: PspC domain-containing protein [unclassified Pedobacter]NII85698.1 phage shock protein PspC (stress-responsive transcriptional regulator) [Pedobacter sp. SG908]NMN39384.1 phage shock protein PspC (stress-responsive transcriptional regulator) [Pedobacter sp. SG918]
MEKTIIINIGNTIIHIEESAYELLKAYLNEVKQYFANHADDLEIVTDIENRIAELLTEQLEEQKKQVVDSANVNSVIAQMGKVKDFDTVEEGEEEPVINNTYQHQYAEKKLYRDMDDRVVAGVCAGIAHYVNADPKWIRVATVLTFFLGGSGILVYALLWIIMPKAKSRIERMEMKGEPANLQGFQKNLDEELLAVKERLGEVNKHAQPIFARLGNFIGEFFEWLGRFISGAGKVIFKIIAGFIVVFGVLFLITLIIGTAAFQGFWDASIYEYFPFSIINEGNRGIILFGAFVVLFVPILALVLFSIRVAFNKQAINKTLSFALLIIWLAGVAITGYQAAKISSEFKQHAELTQTTDLKAYPVYTINIDKSKYFSKEDSVAYHIDANNRHQIVVDDFEDGPFVSPNRIRIDINKSETGVTRLTQKYESQGKTFQSALQNAQNISYNYVMKDSELIFSPRFQLRKGTIWRNQEVRLNLEIPVGTKLILKQDAYRYVNNYWTWECNDSENDHNDSSIWVMTDDGLKCVAKLKEEALKKEQLEQELRDLDHLHKDKPNDTLYQDSVSNRIKEVRKELGIEPEQ